MKLEVRIGTVTRLVEIERAGQNQFIVRGKEENGQIDATEVATNT
jgi:hypothetical protein